MQNPVPVAKKELLRAYKDREIEMGVFAIYCAKTNQNWVGYSRTLDKAKNGIWARLRLGRHPSLSLQAMWNEVGSDAFAFSPLQHLEQADIDYPDQILKDLRTIWCNRLNAHPI